MSLQQRIFKKVAPRKQGPDLEERSKTKEEAVDRLTGKLGKEQANYRPQKETSSKATCFECDHYLQPGEAQGACRRVAGLVEASATCDLFVSRPQEGRE